MARKSKIGTLQEFAELIGITERHAYRLVNDGIVDRLADGNVDLRTSIEAYYENKFCSNEQIDYMTEKARHEKAKRELAELELQKRRNEVHDAENVKIVMGDMLSNLRSQLLGLPTKMAPVLANRDTDYIAHELAKEIEDRLTELSDYSPNLFSDEAVERKDADGEENN